MQCRCHTAGSLLCGLLRKDQRTKRSTKSDSRSYLDDKGAELYFAFEIPVQRDLLNQFNRVPESWACEPSHACAPSLLQIPCEESVPRQSQGSPVRRSVREHARAGSAPNVAQHVQVQEATCQAIRFRTNDRGLVAISLPRLGSPANLLRRSRCGSSRSTAGWREGQSIEQAVSMAVKGR